MTGAWESEWSRSRGLETFLFVSVALFLTHAECQHYRLGANPVLHLSTVHLVQNVLVCLGITKIFCVDLTSEQTPRISNNCTLYSSWWKKATWISFSPPPPISLSSFLPYFLHWELCCWHFRWDCLIIALYHYSLYKSLWTSTWSSCQPHI